MVTTTMHIQSFFDPETFTVTYVVADIAANACIVIDPVLDFESGSGRTSHKSADAVIAYMRDLGLRLALILETHAHADHLSAGAYIRSVLGGKIGIGAQIVAVQKIFSKVFNLKDGFVADGRQFDALFKHGDTFTIGKLKARVFHTPGHTPACLTYVIEDAAFIGDTLFMPDYGTARADFPGGDARTLYRSIRQILSLPDDTRLFTCHDYKAPGRDTFAWESTVREQRQRNVHVHAGIGEDEFAAMRTARDKTLGTPHLILPSIQVNIRAGALPPPEGNGVSYLKLPINAL
ncbi:MAG: MBL fold metallo-hydrolase [Rhodospirillaceae bacterium]|nr:MBL fold metallo-hydrolase [Rhodospirillaceae bacterium]